MPVHFKPHTLTHTHSFHCSHSQPTRWIDVMIIIIRRVKPLTSHYSVWYSKYNFKRRFICLLDFRLVLFFIFLSLNVSSCCADEQKSSTYIYTGVRLIWGGKKFKLTVFFFPSFCCSTTHSTQRTRHFIYYFTFWQTIWLLFRCSVVIVAFTSFDCDVIIRVLEQNNKRTIFIFFLK